MFAHRLRRNLAVTAVIALLIVLAHAAQTVALIHAEFFTGWALLGLEMALRAQGKIDEAAYPATRRSQVWARADVQPTSSCYCEPGR